MSKVFGYLTAIALVFVSAHAQAQDARAQIDDLLAQLAAYEYGDIRFPLRQAHLWVTNALADEDDRVAVAAELATVLEGDATSDGRLFVCRQLARIGGAAEVPVLAALLNDADTTDMARIALQAIPAPEAESALVDALDTTSGSVRIGVINSLGERGAADAVSALKRIAKKGDDAEAEAAIAALGKMGTGHAVHALRKAKWGASSERRQAIADALQVCKQLRKRNG